MIIPNIVLTLDGGQVWKEQLNPMALDLEERRKIKYYRKKVLYFYNNLVSRDVQAMHFKVVLYK